MKNKVAHRVYIRRNLPFLKEPININFSASLDNNGFTPSQKIVLLKAHSDAMASINHSNKLIRQVGEESKKETSERISKKESDVKVNAIIKAMAVDSATHLIERQNGSDEFLKKSINIIEEDINYRMNLASGEKASDDYFKNALKNQGFTKEQEFTASLAHTVATDQINWIERLIGLKD